MTWRKRIGAVALAFLLVASAGVASAAVVDWTSEPAPQPEFDADLTKSVHDMEWGQSADAVRTYENNSGDVSTLNGEVNTTVENPYTLTYSDINVSDWRAFPHDKSDISAIEDSGEWSSATSDDANVTPSIASVETAPGVDAVRFSTSGMGAGDTSTFTFSNFSVTSDESKRFGQVVYDLNSLANGDTYVEVRAVDSDGDYKLVENATTAQEGVVAQTKLGDATTQGSGDGTFDDIQKVEFVVFNGDAEIDTAGLNVEKMSKYDLGSQKMDPQGDGTYQTEPVNESMTGGAVSIVGLDTMGSTFSDAEIHSLQFPAVLGAEYVEADDMMINRTADESVEGGQYPGYKGTANVYVRLTLPDAYDLSWSNAVLRDTQTVTSDRVLEVEYAEGTGETAFGNISDASWSDITSSYSSDGTEITVDDTIQPGQESVLKYKLKLTPDQYDAIATAGGAGGGATGAGGWGNLPLIGGVIAAALAFLKRSGNSADGG